MRPLDRAGFSLLELLLVLLLALASATAAHQIVRLAAGAVRLAHAHNSATRDGVTVWALFNHDLRAAARADLDSPNPVTLELPRPVGEGPVCQQAANSTLIRWHGERTPDPDRDRAWLLADSNSATWLERGIVSVTMANCPDGGAALHLILSTTIPTVAAVRVAEPSRIRSYTSGGQHWLGLEPSDGAVSIQPFAGPIAADGFDVNLAAGSVHLDYRRNPLPPLLLVLPVEPAP